MIHILSIGINKHVDPNVNDLSLAGNDAKALYGVVKDSFTDLGVDKILLDSDATKDNIFAAIGEIKQRSKSTDTVFIYYSGHGTETHWLVPHDFAINNPFDSSIPMEELVKKFSEIDCKVGLLFLDCCFSGGAGSKILNLGLKQKALNSNDDFMSLLTANGKAIITASNLSQPAWETTRLNHGLFTFHLIKALTGDVTFKSKDSFSFQELTEYIIPEVEKEAQLLGESQVPTYKCNIEGSVMLPLLNKGSNYNGFFPYENRFKTDGSISDLLKWGITQPIVDIYENRIGKFNELQIDAINNYGILNGDNLIVSAPTSSGKTIIGEIAAIKNFFDGKRSVFLLPMKSLVNDKYFDLTSKFSQYGLRIIRSTGDRRDQDLDLRNGKFDICLMTYEKFSIMLAQNHYLLNQLGLVLIDELQMLNDKTRGINLELTLTLIKTQANKGIKPQIIGLSGVVGELNRLDEWLNARVLKHTKRPVPLEESIITWNGHRKYINEDKEIEDEQNYVSPVYTGKNSGQVITIPLVKKLLDAGERVIIFRATVSETFFTARYLVANGIRLDAATKTLELLPKSDLSNSGRKLQEFLQYGIAFHNSNLNPTEREIIEGDFRNPSGEIKLIIATTTLAMGINTPADSVIIADLERKTDDGVQDFSVAEYKNMIGRAGRLGFQTNGKSFIITASEATSDQKWRKYIEGMPEDVISQFKFEDTANTLVCIVSFLKKIKKNDLQLVYKELLGNFQKIKTIPDWNNEIQKQFESTYTSLVDAQIFKVENDDVYLTELGRVAGEEGINLQSVINLSRYIQTLGNKKLSIEEIIYLSLLTEELQEFYFPINKRGEAKERSTWLNYANYQGNIGSVSHLNNNAKTLKMFATIHKYINAEDMQNIEEQIQQHNPDRDFSGKVRSVSDRAKSFVNSVIRISSILNTANEYDQSFIKEIIARMELGIVADLLPLSEDSRFNFQRWELIALRSNGYVNIEAIISEKDKIKPLISSENFLILVKT